jgi:hypothetical protein
MRFVPNIQLPKERIKIDQNDASLFVSFYVDVTGFGG